MIKLTLTLTEKLFHLGDLTCILGSLCLYTMKLIAKCENVKLISELMQFKCSRMGHLKT